MSRWPEEKYLFVCYIIMQFILGFSLTISLLVESLPYLRSPMFCCLYFYHKIMGDWETNQQTNTFLEAPSCKDVQSSDGARLQSVRMRTDCWLSHTCWYCHWWNQFLNAQIVNLVTFPILSWKKLWNMFFLLEFSGCHLCSFKHFQLSDPGCLLLQEL